MSRYQYLVHMNRLRRCERWVGFVQNIESMSYMWLRTAGDEKEYWDCDATEGIREYIDNGSLNRRIVTLIKSIYNDKPWPFFLSGRIDDSIYFLQRLDDEHLNLSVQRSVKYCRVDLDC